MGHVGDTPFLPGQKKTKKKKNKKKTYHQVTWVIRLFARAKQNPYHHTRSTRRSCLWLRIEYQIGKLVRKKNVWWIDYDTAIRPSGWYGCFGLIWGMIWKLPHNNLYLFHATFWPHRINVSATSWRWFYVSSIGWHYGIWCTHSAALFYLRCINAIYPLEGLFIIESYGVVFNNFPTNGQKPMNNTVVFYKYALFCAFVNCLFSDKTMFYAEQKTIKMQRGIRNITISSLNQQKVSTSLGGLEPPTFRLTAERANRLRHRDGLSRFNFQCSNYLDKFVIWSRR